MTIVEVLKKMIALQKSLTAIAKEKTEVVKKGDAEALQSLLKEENKHIQAIQKVERLMVHETKIFLQEKGVSTEAPTLAKAMEASEKEEKEALQKGKKALEEQIAELKKQNLLNQQLLEQSLQFVQMSIDLLQPDLETFNYDAGEKGEDNPAQPSRSIFDSKA